MISSLLGEGKKDPEAVSHGQLKEVKLFDATIQRGPGGETHQVKTRASEDHLTTQHGCPVSDDMNSLRIGTRGPQALEDFVFREKLFHFDHVCYATLLPISY